MSLDAATYREVHAREQTNAALVLVTMTHSAFGATLRFVQNNENVTSNGNVFIGQQAMVSAPNESAQPGRGRLTLGDISTAIRKQVMAADIDEQIQVKLDLVLSGSPDTIRYTWPGLEWRGIQIEESEIPGALRQREYAQELWPPRVHKEAEWPQGRW